MNYTALLETINSEPLNTGRDDIEVAQWINAMTVDAWQSLYLKDKDVMRILGRAEGAAFLDALEALSASKSEIKWMLRSISSDGIDIGEQETRAALEGLVAAGMPELNQAQADLLMAGAKIKTSIALDNGFGAGLRSRHIDKARA